ncbi:MAG TPA: HIT family protein [Candidatus Saccharimonadales bacterium]|nr:HIT family protein [Candidatus Saccharimonadales bacterium]
MTTDQCEICAFAAKPDSGELLRTPFWRVSLGHDQQYLGRTYVSLLEHKGSLSELSAAEWADFQRLVRLLEASYERALGSGRPFNWSCMMNNAFQVESAYPHVHWHFIPRHKEPIAMAGQTFVDPKYGHHYKTDSRRQVDPQVHQAIADMLRAAIAKEQA